MYITNKANYTYTMDVNPNNPRRIRFREVVCIQADGVELETILNQVQGIRSRSEWGVTIWRGEDAQFIADNVLF
jgi:hypothetical protein